MTENQYNNIAQSKIDKAVFDMLRDAVLALSEWDALKTDQSEDVRWAIAEMREFLKTYGMAAIRQYFTLPRAGINDTISMDEALRVCYKVIGTDVFPQARNAKIFLEDVVRALPANTTIEYIVSSCQGLWKEKYILRACRKSFRLEEVARAMNLRLCCKEGMDAAHLAEYTGAEIVRAGFLLGCSFRAMMSCRRQGHYSFTTLCWVYARSIIGKFLRI